MRPVARWLSIAVFASLTVAGCPPRPPPNCPNLCANACDPAACEARCDEAVSTSPSACRQARIDQVTCVAYLDCQRYADWENREGNPYPCWIWDGPVDDLCPPDETVFFLSDYEGAPQLYAAPVDGSESLIRLSKPLVAGGEVRGFEPSPDRKHVAYWGTVEDPELVELFTVPWTGGSSTKVNQAIQDAFPPAPFGPLPTAGFRGWSPDGSRIAYDADETSDGTYAPDLHTVALDGSTRTNLTSDLSCSFAGIYCVGVVVWSPDGSRLVYEYASPVAWVIFVDAAEGGSRLQVSPLNYSEPFDSRPRWSPDGSRVLYRNRYDGRLYGNTLDGAPEYCFNCPLPAGEDGVFDHYFWSRDGARVLWLNDWENNPQFAPVVSDAPDATDPILLTSRGDRWVRTTLLPSSVGDHAAYVADPASSGASDLYVSALDGTGQVKISDPLVPGGEVNDFVWNPNGDRVAYVADQEMDEVYELYSAAIDGTGAVKLNGPLVAGGDVGRSIDLGDVKWSPDGTRIAYWADQETDDKFELYGNAADGTSPVKLSAPLFSGDDVLSYFFWSPEGTRVLYRTASDVLFSVAPDGTGHAVLGTGVSWAK